MRRLGLDRQDEPSINYALQPVQVLSDASGLSPLLLGPSVCVGFSTTATAGEYGTVIVQAIAQTAIRATVSSGLGIGWRFRDSVASLPTDLLNPANCEIEPGYELRASSGTQVADVIGPTDPQLAANAIIEVAVVVPAGKQFIVQALAQNAPLQGWLHCEEYPSLRGS